MIRREKKKKREKERKKERERKGWERKEKTSK